MDMLEKLRGEMHQYIEKYGLLDTRTITKSQELDLEVNKNMQSRTIPLKTVTKNALQVSP